MAKKKKGEEKSTIQPKLTDALHKRLKDVEHDEEEDTLNFIFDDVSINIKMKGSNLFITTKRRE